MKTYVYKITRTDGLEYIGITVNLEKRIKSHEKSNRFRDGIMDIQVLEVCDTYQEAEILEETFIKKYDTYFNGLNLTESGKGKNGSTKFNTRGHVYSKESRDKMSESAKRRGCAHLVSYKFTDEDKKHLSDVRKGKCWGPRKINPAEAEKIYQDFVNFDVRSVDLKAYVKKSQRDLVDSLDLEDMRRPSGHKLTKVQIFVQERCEEFGVTPNQIRNIINNKGVMAKNYDEI